MSSNAVNNINTTATTPTTISQNNQNDLYNQKYINQQVQSTIPKTTNLIDDIKISTVLPNSLDNIGESYTFYQKPNDSMATTFNISNNENLATNNLQNITSTGKGKDVENDIGLNNENSNITTSSTDGINPTQTSYPEIPLTANTKKKRSRNPSKIPRPQNCFIIYRREKHQLISAKNPGIANNDISKIIAKMWREEPPEVKEIYHQRAKEEAKRHMLANPGYKYTPRASKNRRKKKLNEENKKFEENHPLKHEFDNPPHQDKNHENIRQWIDNISSPSQEQSIINTLAQGTQNMNSYAMINPLQTTFDDPLYSSSNSGSLAYSACSSASTSSTNLSVYSWSSNSLSSSNISSNLSRGSSISSINEYGNIQQPTRIYEYEFQKPVTTQIYNPYDYKLTQGMSQMHIQQPSVQSSPPIILNVQQPNTTLPLQIQATTQPIQNTIQAQIQPPIQIQQPIQAQMTTQNINIQQPQIGTQMSPPMQPTNTQNVANPMMNNLQNPNTQSSPPGTITYATANISNNIGGKSQFIAVTNPQIQTVYATQTNSIGAIPAYTNDIINPQFQEIKQMPQAQYQQQYYNISTQIPNMNNQGNFQNIYSENRDGRPNV
ncbi:hypothetical protein BCR36DRAFT_583800 [Piromyces finnis]|uniref:HMG box domain-containing protein n=1 Tax=Piromyces finnis TaxID=1754191 RepID=A0A1Y1V8G5_9FUNG|nr:hypothetical protein BCR36DRAFT_583800 [Piromyces finnis]|eukprot:ORX49747.1 hypothetical protein BCR36DRAFT_583800 [Piromyces finnis]